MRFTNSRDGELRATVRVEHRIGRSDIIDLICWKVSREPEFMDSEDVPDNPSRTWVEKTCREVLRNLGHETYAYWADDLHGEDEQEIERWVQAAINGAFPELA